MLNTNETHDPTLRSWVASANGPQTDFPLQNLPYAVFRRAGATEAWRIGVAIGDQVLDLTHALCVDGLPELKDPELQNACRQSTLNALMTLGQPAWHALRLALSRALRAGAPAAAVLADALVPQSAVEYALPAQIGDYTDFYTSIHHATHVGALFRPDNPLLPNYKWVPIGYHGRASSIGISGQQFARPLGQTLPAGAATPELGPARRMDYELELGVFIGKGNAAGQRIALDRADEHVFGLCLLNDWSARDIQAWEYQPLGPFLAKNFATTISPWVVTLEALAPFRQPWARAVDDPQPLPYLDSPAHRDAGAIGIALEVAICTPQMRQAGLPPQRLGQSQFAQSYWSIAQMVAHHTINGCNLQAGDLLGSGTQSGPLAHEAGSLLELTHGGKQPMTLANGETRTFLQDGDEVILRGRCAADGAVSIGFGLCSGTLLPALD
ncbi:fumarylacetoacetase [Silvimonas iriomotensis]|uniref:fumarylacetoacetase n=1 Tax=Silvimonas iriomotensis TaxID=449662 RepID=A0ABQ2P600_9NEIS|nr:fumarylacetoacetase [Silvimonas iriomotensis]GGP19052.1 fumarylacetoacetase [Silvimonas iriomotensis]